MRLEQAMSISIYKRADLCLLAAAAAFLFAQPQPAQAVEVVVTDDFSDGNDTVNPTWTRLDGAAASTGQTWDASSGAYHMTAPTNGDAALDQFDGYGYVGSITGPKYTDVRVEADFLDVQTGFTATFMGVGARLNGDDNPFWVDFDQGLKGYGYQWEPSAANGDGEMVLSLIWFGGISDIGSQRVPLQAGRDYRFVLDITGNVLTGQTFELNEDGSLGTMIGERTRDLVADPPQIDHDGNSSTPRIPHVPYTDGYSGIYAFSHAFILPQAEFTIDNFRTEGTLAAPPGDYNGDGSVDAADYVMWRKSDINGAQGYTDWRTNFGAGGTGGSGMGLVSTAAVPEPGVMGLAMLGLLYGCLIRRSR
jgi:hypothetical protein